VKPRERRKGEHTYRDDKPTSSTKTKTKPQKCETSCEGDDAAPYLNAKWERRHAHDEFHVKRRQDDRKEARESNGHPKAFRLMGGTHGLKRYQRLHTSNEIQDQRPRELEVTFACFQNLRIRRSVVRCIVWLDGPWLLLKLNNTTNELLSICIWLVGAEAHRTDSETKSLCLVALL
jgi:hypothetical protein